jgi:acyl-CoA synthetase (NDP forming)
LGPVDSELADTLHGARIPLLLGTQRSAKAISLLIDWVERDARPISVVRRPLPPAGAEFKSAGALPFMASKELLGKFGVPVVETVLAQTASDAIRAAASFGYPVALKVESIELPHKSDAGCVVLGCRNANEVTDAFAKITTNAVKAGVSRVDGVLVQPMADKVAEVFVGITTDPVLGPAIVFGLGGIFIETIKDTVTEIPPIDEKLALDMIHRLRGRAVLLGGRGTEEADIEALARVLVSVGDLALTYRDRLISADLNPLMVRRRGQGAVAVDALLEMIGFE